MIKSVYVLNLSKLKIDVNQKNIKVLLCVDFVNFALTHYRIKINDNMKILATSERSLMTAI